MYVIREVKDFFTRVVCLKNYQKDRVEKKSDRYWSEEIAVTNYKSSTGGLSVYSNTCSVGTEMPEKTSFANSPGMQEMTYDI